MKGGVQPDRAHLMTTHVTKASKEKSDHSNSSRKIEESHRTKYFNQGFHSLRHLENSPKTGSQILFSPDQSYSSSKVPSLNSKASSSLDSNSSPSSSKQNNIFRLKEPIVKEKNPYFKSDLYLTNFSEDSFLESQMKNYSKNPEKKLKREYEILQIKPVNGILSNGRKMIALPDLTFHSQRT